MISGEIWPFFGWSFLRFFQPDLQRVFDHRILAAYRNRCDQCLQASVRFSGGVPYARVFNAQNKLRCADILSNL